MLYDPKTGKRNGFSTLSSHQFSHTEKLAWHQFQAAMVNRTVILTGLLQKRTEGPTWSLEQHPRHRPKNHQNVGLVWFHPLNMATPLHISWFEFQSHHINDPRCMGNSTMRCYKPYIYISGINLRCFTRHTVVVFSFPDPSLPGIFRCNEVEVATRMSSRCDWLFPLGIRLPGCGCCF